jgi:hypothetical protein
MLSRALIVVASLVACVACPSAFAQRIEDIDKHRCSEPVLDLVGAYAKLDGFSYAQDNGAIVAGVCMPWPGNKSRTIAAFAYDAGVADEKTLLLAVVDIYKNRVIAFYTRKLETDAAEWVTDTSLRIDVAPYILSGHTRAFALRTNTFHDRCGYEGGSDDNLTLFVVDGKALRPVLQQTMAYWQIQGIRCAGGDAEITITTTKAFIAVEPTSTNGFADLRLTAKSGNGFDDPRLTPKSDRNGKPVSAIIKYTGREYDVSPWKAVFGMP